LNAANLAEVAHILSQVYYYRAPEAIYIGGLERKYRELAFVLRTSG
jgi:hypothetical protein